MPSQTDCWEVVAGVAGDLHAAAGVAVVEAVYVTGWYVTVQQLELPSCGVALSSQAFQGCSSPQCHLQVHQHGSFPVWMLKWFPSCSEPANGAPMPLGRGDCGCSMAVQLWGQLQVSGTNVSVLHSTELQAGRTASSSWPSRIETNFEQFLKMPTQIQVLLRQPQGAICSLNAGENRSAGQASTSPRQHAAATAQITT